MIEAEIFTAQFVMIFALGFQSQSVNGGYYKTAACTSFIIGACSLYLYRLMPSANVTEMLSFLVSGPLAIWCSMYTHRNVLKRRSL